MGTAPACPSPLAEAGASSSSGASSWHRKPGGQRGGCGTSRWELACGTCCHKTLQEPTARGGCRRDLAMAVVGTSSSLGLPGSAALVVAGARTGRSARARLCTGTLSVTSLLSFGFSGPCLSLQAEQVPVPVPSAGACLGLGVIAPLAAPCFLTAGAFWDILLRPGLCCAWSLRARDAWGSQLQGGCLGPMCPLPKPDPLETTEAKPAWSQGSWKTQLALQDGVPGPQASSGPHWDWGGDRNPPNL